MTALPRYRNSAIHTIIMSANVAAQLASTRAPGRSPLGSANPHRRLIPGSVPPPASSLLKKKASSVRSSQALFRQDSHPKILSASPSLKARFLPQPGEARGRLRLAHIVATDIASFVIGAVVGMIASNSLPIAPLAPSSASSRPELVGLAFLQAVLLTLLAYSEGAYRTDNSFSDVTSRLAKAAFWSSVLVALSMPRFHSPSGLASLGASVILGVMSLCALRVCRRWASNHRPVARNVLMIGATSRARALADYFRSQNPPTRNLVGFLDDQLPRGFEVLGPVSDLESIARANFVDEVLVALNDPVASARAVRIAAACHLDVGLIPDIPQCSAAPAAIDQFGVCSLLRLHEERPPDLMLAAKRGIDILGAACGLLFASPVLAAVALAIRLDSPGPVFYSAKRAGQKGRTFPCHKFRTMVVHADAVKDQLRSQNQRQGPFFKMERDPRITRIGRFLRKYSLDELPQLWNVLRGDMSLVGPRPHPLDDYAGYRLADLCRLDVKPGLTGLWQTTARHDPSFETSIRLDQQYIECWSLALDFRILLRTLGVVLAGGGC